MKTVTRAMRIQDHVLLGPTRLSTYPKRKLSLQCIYTLSRLSVSCGNVLLTTANASSCLAPRITTLSQQSLYPK